ncbi:YdaU family protein [Bartonella gliris]|uniref:YdaU family protein n=1 Tax=Bartonella gliris TaxID=3004109 RepID=UPI00295EECB7|nr:YdaU family protein [Bartonella gliris]
MSNGMPWIRFHLYDWISGTNGMTLEQRGVYITLLVCMYEKKEPLKTDFQTLARVCHCSQKKFAAIVEYLMRNNKLVETDNGLWNTRVEEELNDFADKKEHISQVRSEAGKKGAQAKNNTKQHVNNFAEANDKQNGFFAEANAKQNQAIKNQNKNIYKKTKTIVLAKKEIGSESLETTNLVQEPTEVAAVETTSEQITTSSDNQPSIHEQENVPKKAKRAQANRGCRLPEDFKPNLQYAIDQGLTHDEALLETERFTNYWIANPGKNANKRDWQRTWYNWVTSPIGMLAKKKARLEQEKRLGGHYGKFTQKTFTEQLAEGFNELRNHLSSGEDYGNDQSGVSIDAESWEYIDETGGSANLRCLQSSTSVALCESFS